LRDGLAHRYSFEGSGATAVDSWSGEDGSIEGTTLDGSGSIVLDPDAGEQFVELPSEIVSSFASVTVESWFVWDDSPVWTRLFDFGNTEEGEIGVPGTGSTFLLFTPRSNVGPDHPYAAFSFGEGPTEVTCADDAPLSVGDMHHLAVVVDTQNQTFTLFLDGSLSCAIALTAPLSDLQDVNCWIGRSQFATDTGFAGSVDEFRIYDIPFTQRQAAFSFAAGPNPAWLDE
jgi:hypothetical protein